jgi:DNA mismatch repair protein MutL
VFPVVLLFIEMPTAEVDVNVHPSKTEVRFRQQTVIHDFVRESVRAALMKARPVPQFLTEINAQPTATCWPQQSWPGQHALHRWRAAAMDCSVRRGGILYEPATTEGGFALQAPPVPAATARFEFAAAWPIDGNAALSLARASARGSAGDCSSNTIADPKLIPDHGCAPPIAQDPQTAPTLESLRTLRPLGQIRNSFHSCRERRRTVDYRSTRGARARSVRKRSCGSARRSGLRASVCSCLLSSN